MKIAHISDIHWLDTTGAHFTDFLNKRISGGINLLAGRARKHSKVTTQKALEKLHEIQCDHVILTGDLSNLALPAEFTAVKAVLNQYFDDEKMSIVPGNHDFYTRESLKHHRFETMIYTSKPGNFELDSNETWPYVRKLENVAIIGLNSAFPRPWFVAGGKLGKTQLQNLENALKKLSDFNGVKIVALHHHLKQVVMTPGESLRNLTDRDEFLRICQKYHVDMIVHGHNHDYSLYKAGNVIVSEAGSCSVCTFKKDNRAGKFNVYTIENNHISLIETYRFENDEYSLWKTWEPKEIQ